MADQQSKGMMIVIEGADGAGKSTQAHVLTQRLTAAGYDVQFFKFPQYDQPSSHFIRSYLNGEYGNVSDIGPYTGALFYALDRYEAGPRIQGALNAGKIVVADRYVASNMAHQGSKITDSIEQRSFFIWEDSLEFQLLGIPRPDVNILLRLPPEMAYGQAGRQRQRSYTQQKRDLHEQDIEHLKSTAQAYDTLCQLFPNDFKAVEAADNGQLLSIPELSNRVWEIVKPLLPPAPHKGRKLVLNLKPPPEPRQTSDKNPAPGVAERRPKPRQTYDLSLLALGHLLATSADPIKYKCPWLTSAATSDKLAWITPKELPANIKRQFNESMERIRSARQTVADKLDLPSARLLIPLAARASVDFQPDELSWQLRLSELSEIRQLVPATSGQNVSRDDGAAKIKQLINERLSRPSAIDTETINLVDISPRNEVTLLATDLYGQSGLSQRELSEAIDNWNYDEKAESLRLALDRHNSVVLRAARYSFDVLDDWTRLLALYDAGIINSLRLQAANIEFGCETPAAVEEAGLAETFQAAVMDSEKLYRLLVASGWGELAGYACLSGHKFRFQFDTTAERLGRAMHQPKKNQPAYSQLKIACEKIAEAHPIIGRWLTDVQPSTSNRTSSNRKQRSKKSNQPHQKT